MSRFTRFALVLCTVALSVFVGQSANASSQKMDADMARLLPEGAAIVAYTPSMSKLTSELSDIVKQFDQQAAGMLMFMGPQSLLSMQLKTTQKVRSDMPAAIALTPGANIGDTPEMTIIFAVNGATADNVKANSKDMKMVFLEGTDWVAMTTGAAYQPRSADQKAPSVASKMLSGILSVSIDQAMFRTKYGNALEEQFYEALSAGSSAAGSDASDQRILDLNKKIATKLVNGFDRWDMSLNLDPQTPGWTVQYTPSSPDCVLQPSSDLAVVAGHLATELPMQMAMSTDVAVDMIDVARMFVSAEGTAVEKSLSEYLDYGVEFLDQVSGGIGVSMGMSGDGMSLVQTMRVKDVAKTLSIVDGLMEFFNKANWGITSEAIPVTVGASTSRAYRLKFDLEQMKKAFPAEFKMSENASNTLAGGMMQADAQMGELLNAMQGPDGMIVRFISKDDWLAVVIGDAKLLGTARRALAMAGGSNAGVDRALTSTDGSPVMASSMDLRSVMIGMGKFLAAHPGLSKMMEEQGVGAMLAKLPASPAAMVYMSSSSSETATRFTTMLDLSGVAAFNKDMDTLMAEQMKKMEEAQKAQKAKEKQEKAGTP
ncbi:MAG TPA: hypothetical protein DEO57_00030 [Phycisphaerales bacterium]|nr:hypothetical protein [Phycisphaerales bacterium]